MSTYAQPWYFGFGLCMRGRKDVPISPLRRERRESGGGGGGQGAVFEALDISLVSTHPPDPSGWAGTNVVDFSSARSKVRGPTLTPAFTGRNGGDQHFVSHEPFPFFAFTFSPEDPPKQPKSPSQPEPQKKEKRNDKI
jgi:hypothetical protein